MFLFSVLFLSWIGVLWLAGWVYRPAGRVPGARVPLRVYVPAHNEARVIGRLLESLRRAHYPGVDVVVVADRCTDATAQIAQVFDGLGLLPVTVWERVTGLAGKQHVIREALALFPPPVGGGAVVLDADNVVDADFLARCSEWLAGGVSYVQGRIETLNPAQSWVSRSYAAMYWQAFWAFAEGRGALNMPIFLGGTGFAVGSCVLEQVPFAPRSLVDDFEYSLDLALAGYRGVWDRSAVTYDEKPVGLIASIRQRTRWQRGMVQVLFSHGSRLAVALGRGRLWPVDVAAIVIMPVGAALSWWGLAQAGPLSYFSATVLAGVILAAPGFLRYGGWRYPLNWIVYPIFCLTSIVPVVWGTVTFRRRGWAVTQHGIGGH